jgi:L-malate glycosyltransferase
MTGRSDNSSNRPGAAVRVCFVIDNLARAGTESQLLLLLKQLDRTRVTPYLCLLDGQGEASRELEPLDVPVLRLGVRRLASMSAVRQALRFWKFLRQQRIDVVQTYFPDSTRFAAPIAKAAGIRGVFGSRRNIGHWMTRRDMFVARLYNHWFISKVVTNCEAARLAVIKQEGAKPENVVVLPNGIDLGGFQEIPPWKPKAQSYTRRVGMVGNLREVKGPDLLIRAAKLVLDAYPCTEFVIAGQGDRVPYQALIDEMELTRNVRLLGMVTDIPAFLATLDVAVLPSRAEGFSNALMEYKAAGRPIVATDVGGNGELVKSGVNGLLVEPHETELARGINELLSDPASAALFAETASIELSRYGVTRLLNQFEQVYRLPFYRLSEPPTVPADAVRVLEPSNG